MCMVGILPSLIRFFGVSGQEDGIREFIKKHIRPYVDDVTVDTLGNLIAHKKGNGPKIMLAAHMDEIGLMVKRIEERGFIYCTSLGDVDAPAFVGAAVHFVTKKGVLHGFITTEQMSAGKYIVELPKIEDIFIDTGLTKDELKAHGIEIGSLVHLGSNACCQDRDGLIFGKALDNRLGCYGLIEEAQRLKQTKAHEYFVFTVQEEFGLYGAKTSAWEISPDWGIAVDTTFANDTFAEPSRWIGKGPCITVKDGEFVSHHRVVEALKQTARKKRIPFQLEATEEGTTDAATIQTTRGGIPTGILSIPIRNAHTTAGIAKMVDVTHSIALLTELLKRPPRIA